MQPLGEGYVSNPIAVDKCGLQDPEDGGLSSDQHKSQVL
jgi:hypothetical protein